MAHDLVIRGGTIVDGTGRRAYRADIGLRDGHIAEIGDRVDAHDTIDASDRLVTPGFIDIHSHSEADLRDLSPTLTVSAPVVLMLPEIPNPPGKKP